MINFSSRVPYNQNEKDNRMKIRKIKIFLRNFTIFFFLSSILAVIVLRYIPVYITPLMIIRCTQQVIKGEKPILKHQWVSKEKISPHLAMAVIASEDNLFAEHNGFDFQQIGKAIEDRKKNNRKRGASTISQQTAKNVFLWPSSNWLRKGLEAYFTVLIEFFWSKERIMEIYLNSIEMGYGIYGAEATAKNHFNTSADKLTREQSALIAASLPNPIRFNSARPTKYMHKRKEQIVRLMGLVKQFPENKTINKQTH